MTFREYIYYNKLQVKDIAELLYVDRSYLSSALTGRIAWPKKLSYQVERFTEGLIKAAEIQGRFQTDIDSERYAEILKEGI